MKNKKHIGWLLIIGALLIVLGIAFNNPHLWSVVDIFVFLICFGIGLYLLLQKQ